MNLEQTADQRDMVATIRHFLQTRGPSLRAYSRPIWTELADFGILGLIGAPPGSDLGPVEAVLIAEEMGAALVGGPLIWSDVLAHAVPGVMDGDVVATGMFDGQVAAADLADADVLVIVGRSGAVALEVARLERASAYSIDPTAPLSVVAHHTGASAVADAGEVQSWTGQTRLLAAAQLVGIARRAVEISVEHAKVRQQFGRAIGSFQSIKHLIADLHTSMEMARSQVLVAAVSSADGSGAGNSASTSAAILAERAALAATRGAIQVHGGMGFAAETDCHLLYKRFLSLQAQFGGTHRMVRERLDATGSPLFQH